MSLKCEVLRERVTEYQQSTGEKKRRIFEIILARVDRLLIQEASRMKRSKLQLSCVDLQDLYQCTVVGLYRALDSVKSTDSGDRAQARIISYAREEIRKTYLGRKRSMFTMDPDIIAEISSSGESHDDIRLETNEIISIIKSMIRDGVIKESDFGMMVDNSVNGLSYCEIGRRRGFHYTTVSNRVKKIKAAIVERLSK